MQESFPPEHSSELLGDPLEQLLDGSRVTYEGGGHLEPSWWNVTDGSLNIAMSGVASIHYVRCVKHLLGQLWHGQCSTNRKLV